MDPDLSPIEFAFPGALRDRIIAAIRSGTKTATSSLLREYELAGDPLPAVGDRGAVVDSNGEPVFAIETVGVETVPLRDVPLAHALAEGEGYASVADWRRGHLRFWTSDAMREELGAGFRIDDDTVVVLERFVRVW
ncbi:RNA-binding protein [Rhodococcus sp. 06-1477-1B]|nr:RNA-binding protein [Rhodococcus sp. 06-1477-1B]